MEIMSLMSATVSIVIIAFIVNVLRRSRGPKIRSLFLMMIMQVIWLIYIVLYNFGILILSLPTPKNSGVILVISILINIFSCLSLPFLLKDRVKDKEMYIDRNIINVFMVLLGVFSVVWFFFNIYYFSNLRITEYFGSSNLIRAKRFEFSYSGAPILYSIVEYLSYIFLPLTFTVIVYANKNVIFKYLIIIFLCVISISITNFSRTPILIFFLTSLFSIIYRVDIIKNLISYVRFGSLIFFVFGFFAINVVAAYRDDSVKNSYEIVQNVGIPLGSYNPVYGTLLSNYLYIYTSINNLSDFVGVTGKNEMGAKTFGPLASFARRLSSDSQIDSNGDVFELGGGTNRSLFGQSAFYNASTGFKSLIQDYGYPWGIIVMLIIVFSIILFAQIFPNSIMLRFAYIVIGSWVFNSGFTNYFQSAGKAIIMGVICIIFFNFFIRPEKTKFNVKYRELQ